jgi:hypothetical protein
MALHNATPPSRLWRIGRYPDPFAWTPWEYLGTGRFDDPQREFRVLYTAEQRLTCFVETLAPFRTDVRWLAEVRQLPLDPDDEDGLRDAGRVPDDWHVLRRIGWLECRRHLLALDLRSLETREAIRTELAPWLNDHGYRDLDLSDVLNRDRSLTQEISRWAYDRGYRAIAYTSRFGVEFDCWVLFGGQQPPEEPVFTPLGSEAFARGDQDLIEAARLFGLRL